MTCWWEPTKRFLSTFSLFTYFYIQEILNQIVKESPPHEHHQTQQVNLFTYSHVNLILFINFTCPLYSCSPSLTPTKAPLLQKAQIQTLLELYDALKHLSYGFCKAGGTDLSTNERLGYWYVSTFTCYFKLAVKRVVKWSI